MSDLGNFFSLIGEEKKKKSEKNKEIIGEVSLGDLFSTLSEEKKKLKEKNLKKEKELEKLKKEAKIFESFLFSESPKIDKNAKEAVKVLEKELLNLKNTSYNSIDRLMRGISVEYDISPTKLHNVFKDKHNVIPDEWVKQQKEEIDTSNWKSQYVPLEVETEDILKPDPLKPTEGLGSDLVSKEESTIDKSLEILEQLIPEEERIDDTETEISVLKREMNQLRKMVYETVRMSATQGGGGEVRLEFLDDVDRDSSKVNNKILKYDSSIGKWIGVEAGGMINMGVLSGIASADPETIPQGATLSFEQSIGQFIATTITTIAGYPITDQEPDDNDVLKFNSENSKWIFDSPFQIVDLSDGVEDGNQDYGFFE